MSWKQCGFDAIGKQFQHALGPHLCKLTPTDAANIALQLCMHMMIWASLAETFDERLS
jgi:hypothetical protein